MFSDPLIHAFISAAEKHQPFLLRDASGWWSPWLRGLFDRLVFESSVDIFFNLLLVLAPFVGIGYVALGRGKAALVARVPCITTISGAAAAVEAIAHARDEIALSLQERIDAQARTA